MHTDDVYHSRGKRCLVIPGFPNFCGSKVPKRPPPPPLQPHEYEPGYPIYSIGYENTVRGPTSTEKSIIEPTSAEKSIIEPSSITKPIQETTTTSVNKTAAINNQTAQETVLTLNKKKALPVIKLIQDVPNFTNKTTKLEGTSEHLDVSTLSNTTIKSENKTVAEDIPAFVNTSNKLVNVSSQEHVPIVETRSFKLENKSLLESNTTAILSRSHSNIQPSVKKSTTTLAYKIPQLGYSPQYPYLRSFNGAPSNRNSDSSIYAASQQFTPSLPFASSPRNYYFGKFIVKR